MTYTANGRRAQAGFFDLRQTRACARCRAGPLILDDVSFSIRPGGFIAVVGSSGSGKSTLLRCLLGFERLSAGGIFFDNQNFQDMDLRAVLQQVKGNIFHRNSFARLH